MMHFRVLLGCLLLLAPQATADHLEPSLPPSWSGGSYDEATHTINITWQPPGNDTATPYVYHVYRDGVIVANTTQTWHVDHVTWSHAVFHVVAEDGGGESLPSQPLLVQQNPLGVDPWLLFGSDTEAISIIGPNGPCELVSSSLEPNRFPYLFIRVHEECIGPGAVEVGDGMPVKGTPAG